MSSSRGGYLRATERRTPARPPRPLSILLTHLKNEAPELVPAVELWTRPPRDRYFDSGTDSIATARHVYFELTGLEDDKLLAAPFVSALMGSIWKRIQNPRAIKERKAVIIDEAWSFLTHPALFRVIEDMFRTIRKFNGFVTLSTQSPKDVKDVVGNPDCFAFSVPGHQLVVGLGIREPASRSEEPCRSHRSHAARVSSAGRHSATRRPRALQSASQAVACSGVR